MQTPLQDGSVYGEQVSESKKINGLLVGLQNETCREEQTIFAKYILDNWTVIKLPEGRRPLYDWARIILGEGELLLQKTSAIEDPFKRFQALIGKAYQFHNMGEDELEQKSIQAIHELLGQFDAGLDTEKQLHYERNRVGLTGDFTGLLRKIGRTEEGMHVWNRFIAENSEKISYEENRQLAELLRFQEHPAYSRFEAYDSLDTLHNRDKKLEKAIRLIRDKRLEEAEHVLETFNQDAYVTATIIPPLFETGLESPLLKKSWRMRMTNCLETTMVYHLKTRDPSILAASCLNETARQVLYEEGS